MVYIPSAHFQHFLYSREGLPCAVTECSSSLNTYHDVKFPESRLVYHLLGGRVLALRQGVLDSRYRIRKNHLDLYPREQYDSIVCGPGEAHCLVVDIPPHCEISIQEEGKWKKRPGVNIQFYDRRLETLVFSLFHAQSKTAEPLTTIMLSTAIVDRLFELANASAYEAMLTGTMSNMLSQLIDFDIDTVTLERAAYFTGLGKTQFSKIFRNTFGVPFHRYVLIRRVQIAAKRLRTSVGMTQLAQDLGFSSHAHFSTVFRQVAGRTPKDFRAFDSTLEIETWMPTWQAQMEDS